jgi:hypothetical protein
MPRPMRPTNGDTKPRKADRMRGNGAPQNVSDEEVARRAYEIYQYRGGTHGADLDDWLEAERQLRPGATRVPRPEKPASRRRKTSEGTSL